MVTEIIDYRRRHKIACYKATDAFPHLSQRGCKSIVQRSKVAENNDGGRALNASAHLLSRALVNQSASENWCIKY